MGYAHKFLIIPYPSSLRSSPHAPHGLKRRCAHSGAQVLIYQCGTPKGGGTINQNLLHTKSTCYAGATPIWYSVEPWFLLSLAFGVCTENRKQQYSICNSATRCQIKRFSGVVPKNRLKEKGFQKAREIQIAFRIDHSRRNFTPDSL